MVKIETNLENLEKIVISMDNKIDTILKEQENVRLQNVTRAELETELKRIETAIEGTKRRHTVTVWITSALATIISIVMTLLVTYFISNVGR